MITLALDASTYRATIAVLRDGVAAAEGEAEMRGATEERLMPAVDATLRAAGIATVQIDRVVCGSGPGSFTSLRIAASIAKGIAFGADVPLFAVSSLALLVAGNASAPGVWLAASDALRGQWYAGVFELGDEGVSERQTPRVVDAGTLADLEATHGGRLVGAVVRRDAAGERSIAAAPAHRIFASSVAAIGPLPDSYRVDVRSWEPVYGRLAEAQVKWEAAHGRRLDVH